MKIKYKNWFSHWRPKREKRHTLTWSIMRLLAARGSRFSVGCFIHVAKSSHAAKQWACALGSCCLSWLTRIVPKLKLFQVSNVLSKTRASLFIVRAACVLFFIVHNFQFCVYSRTVFSSCSPWASVFLLLIYMLVLICRVWRESCVDGTTAAIATFNQARPLSVYLHKSSFSR